MVPASFQAGSIQFQSRFHGFYNDSCQNVVWLTIDSIQIGCVLQCMFQPGSTHICFLRLTSARKAEFLNPGEIQIPMSRREFCQIQCSFHPGSIQICCVLHDSCRKAVSLDKLFNSDVLWPSLQARLEVGAYKRRWRRRRRRRRQLAESCTAWGPPLQPGSSPAVV